MPSDVPRAQIGEKRSVVHDPLRARIDLLSPNEAAVIGAAGAWGTLDELAARGAESGALGTRGAVQATLSALVERGVLTPEGELFGLLCAAAREEDARPRPEVATIGIPTKERPESLRRALERTARDVADSGRAIDLVIVDEAEGERAAHARELAIEIGRRFGVRVRYADRGAKKRFAARVAALAGVAPDVARAALVPEVGNTFAAGAARNLLLLDSPGRCSLQLDDDTLCDLRAAPATGRGLHLRSFEDPTELWFDGGHGGDGEERGGVASAHERLLGRRAAWLVERALAESGGAGDVDPARASTGLLARIASGGRVACTQLGVRGDCAMGAMGYLLTLGQPSRARLLADERTYRETVETRRLTRAVTAETLTDQELCMTFAIGLDGRTALPPFPAVHRNEDGLFGNVLAACEPTAIFGHLPWTLVHEPEDRRVRPFDHVFEQIGRVGVNDFVAGLVSSSRNVIDVRSPALAFESLGRSLLAWCEIPERDLFERIWWMLARTIAQRLARMDLLLRSSARSPAFWARDLERLADVGRERVEDPERAVPFEWAELRDRREARARTVRHVSEYGQLLVAWPALLGAARTLAESGPRLGEDAP